MPVEIEEEANNEELNAASQVRKITCIQTPNIK